MEFINGNIYIRPNGPMTKGLVVEGHEHKFDHVTVCFFGAIRIVALLPDGRKEITLEAPRPDYEGESHALIRAGVEHEITALVDGSIFWCVYSHRNPQGEVVDRYEGFDAAYGMKE